MPIDLDASENHAAADLAVDFWKLLKVSDRLLDALPEDRRKRVGAQLRFSAGRLETHLNVLGITLPTFEGQAFGPELPALAINADDFANAANLIVDSALEPAVIWQGKVLKNARVMLREGDVDVSRD